MENNINGRKKADCAEREIEPDARLPAASVSSWQQSRVDPSGEDHGPYAPMQSVTGYGLSPGRGVTLGESVSFS